MVVSSAIGASIVEGNIFDYGNFTSDGTSSPTTYAYDYCVFTNADVKITGNVLSGIASGGTHIYSGIAAGSGGSQIISENIFLRGASTIVAYIDVSTIVSDCVIVDNEFDQYTIDGYTETLVALPTPGSSAPIVTYERNKNQTGILQIQKKPYVMSKQATPCVTPADRFEYTENTNQNWADSNQSTGGGYYNTNVIAAAFQQQGIAVSYATPFAPEAALHITGNFELTNGSSSVTVYPFGPSPYGGPSGSFSPGGYVVFGNDNVFYTIVSATIGSSSGDITTLTLSSNYNGVTRTAVNAIFYPGSGSGNFNPLSYKLYLSGPLVSFTGTSGNNFVTASGSVANYLVVGSYITFNTDATGDLYKVTGVSGNTVNISPNLGASISGASASVGASQVAVNFSINLSELLPKNVRILSTLFGIYGVSSQNTAPIVNAFWGANITSDYGGKYSGTLQGTFNVTNGSLSVSTTVNQVGILNVGSSICFNSQVDYVYTVKAVTSTTITLNINYFGTSNSATGASYFDNSLADARNYPIPNVAVGTFGSNIGVSINNGGTSSADFASYTQYVKIDPEASGFSAFTGSGRLLRYNLSISALVATPCNLFFPESPLIVKYRW